MLSMLASPLQHPAARRAFLNKLPRFRYTPHNPSELMRLLASISSTTTCCGRAHHHHENPSSLYGPSYRVLFIFLDMGFRESPFSDSR
jgi:hypothetical protein